MNLLGHFKNAKNIPSLIYLYGRLAAGVEQGVEQGYRVRGERRSRDGA